MCYDNFDLEMMHAGIILATAGTVVSILNEVVLPYFPVS